MKLIATETAYKGNDLYVKEFELVGGMSLRDYFAAKAIINAIGSPKENAEWAYQVADAMMKERSK
jgi:hypothetical protein